MYTAALTHPNPNQEGPRCNPQPPLRNGPGAATPRGEGGWWGGGV